GGQRRQPQRAGPVPRRDQRRVGLTRSQVQVDPAGRRRDRRRRRRQRRPERPGPGGRAGALLDVGRPAGPGDQEARRRQFLVGPHRRRPGQPERRGQRARGRQPVAVVDLPGGDRLDQRLRHLAGSRPGPPVESQREVDRRGRPGHPTPLMKLAPLSVMLPPLSQDQYVPVPKPHATPPTPATSVGPAPPQAGSSQRPAGPSQNPAGPSPSQPSAPAGPALRLGRPQNPPRVGSSPRPGRSSAPPRPAPAGPAPPPVGPAPPPACPALRPGRLPPPPPA